MAVTLMSLFSFNQLAHNKLCQSPLKGDWHRGWLA